MATQDGDAAASARARGERRFDGIESALHLNGRRSECQAGGGEGLGLRPGGGRHEAAHVGGLLGGAVGRIPRDLPSGHRVADPRVVRVVELGRARRRGMRADGDVSGCALDDGVAGGAVRGAVAKARLVVHRVQLPRNSILFRFRLLL